MAAFKGNQHCSEAKVIPSRKYPERGWISEHLMNWSLYEVPRRITPVQVEGLNGVQSLHQIVQNEICVHGTTLAPTRYPTRININFESDVLLVPPSRHIREVRHLQLLGSVRLELTVDAVQWVRDAGVSEGGTCNLAPLNTAQAQGAYQPLNRTPSSAMPMPPDDRVIYTEVSLVYCESNSGCGPTVHRERYQPAKFARGNGH